MIFNLNKKNSEVLEIPSILNKILTYSSKIKLLLSLILSILAALLEAVVLLFLNIAFGNSELLGMEISNNKAALIGIFLAIISAFLKTKTLSLTASSAASIGTEISFEIIKKQLSTQNNYTVSEIISAINIQVSQVVAHVIRPFMILISNLFISVAICIALYLTIGNSIFGLFFIIGFSYLFTFKINKNKIKKLSRSIDFGNKVCVEEIKSLSNLKDTIFTYGLNDIKSLITPYFYKDKKLRESIANYQNIALIPRNIVEMVILVIAFQLIISGNGYSSIKISDIAALAFAALRLLPLMQNSYQSISGINAFIIPFKNVIGLIKDYSSKNLLKSFKNLNYKKLLKNYRKVKIEGAFNLNKRKIILNSNYPIGSLISIKGNSGAGKSTLFKSFIYNNDANNLIKLTSDNKPEMSVPIFKDYFSIMTQDNFIIDDSSIYENITFRNIQKLSNSFKELDIFDSLNIKNNKSSRGLSGGEKQRICFVRSLQKEALFLLLDEPTSALDDERVKIFKKILIKAKKNYLLTFLITHDPRLNDLIDYEFNL